SNGFSTFASGVPNCERYSNLCYRRERAKKRRARARIHCGEASPERQGAPAIRGVAPAKARIHFFRKEGNRRNFLPSPAAYSAIVLGRLGRFLDHDGAAPGLHRLRTKGVPPDKLNARGFG